MVPKSNCIVEVQFTFTNSPDYFLHAARMFLSQSNTAFISRHENAVLGPLLKNRLLTQYNIFKILHHHKKFFKQSLSTLVNFW